MNVGAIIAAASGACVVIAYLAHWARGAVRWLVALGRAVEQVNQRSGQLVNNGGSTLKDAVDALRTEVAELHAKVDGMQPRRTRWPPRW